MNTLDNQQSAGERGDLASSQKWIIRNGIGIQIMETLAVGAFLTALAVHLGAPNWMIGAFAAIPHLSQIAQLPALWTVEHHRERRKIYLISGMIARPMLLVIGISAVLFEPRIALWAIFIAFAIRYIAGAFLSCSWNSWMRDLIPDNEMGRLFGSRQRKMIGVGIVFSLLAAAFVDGWQRFAPWDTTYAYALVYLLAFFGGAYSVVCAKRIFEPPMSAPQHHSIMLQLRAPFSHDNYRRLIVFLGSWNFAINLAAPFFTVYMLRRLDYELTLVIGLATLSQIAAFLTVRNWGAIADRLTNKAVLATCCPLFILAIFAWTFTTLPDPHAYTLPLLVVIHIVTGISTAGVNLATGNIALKLAPVGNATSYLAASSMVNASAAGIAALIGGITVDLFASYELALTLHWQGGGDQVELEAMHFSHWDFFFVFSTLVGFYSLHRLTLVTEEGKVEDQRIFSLLVDSTFQGLRALSTVAGLRSASNFPLDELMEEPGNKDLQNTADSSKDGTPEPNKPP